MNARVDAVPSRAYRVIDLGRVGVLIVSSRISPMAGSQR